MAKIDEVRVGKYGVFPFFSEEVLLGFGSELLHLLFGHFEFCHWFFDGSGWWTENCFCVFDWSVVKYVKRFEFEGFVTVKLLILSFNFCLTFCSVTATAMSGFFIYYYYYFFLFLFIYLFILMGFMSLY